MNVLNLTEFMFCLNVFQLFLIAIEAWKYEQERAFISQWDPSFMRDVSVVTLRRRRGGSYTSDFRGILVYPAMNNISFTLSFEVKGMKMEIKKKFCDFEKDEWLADLWNSTCSEPFTCPLQPKRYTFTHLEFPPRNFPVIIPGDTKLVITFQRVKSQQVLLQVKVNIKVH